MRKFLNGLGWPVGVQPLLCLLWLSGCAEPPRTAPPAPPSYTIDIRSTTGSCSAPTHISVTFDSNQRTPTAALQELVRLLQERQELKAEVEPEREHAGTTKDPPK